MKKAIDTLVVSNLLFILLLSLAGSFSGVLGELLYYLSFALPVTLALLLWSKKEKGLFSRACSAFGIKRENVLFTLPLVMPAVAIIFLAAYVTSLALGAFGFEGSTVESASLFEMLFRHAFLPSVCEELLFRLLPFIILAPISKKGAVLISSLLFAFAHCNLFQIPYAFIAGFIFMVIDIACESILPSLLLHFINNAVSVFWIKYCTDFNSALAFVIILALLSILSIIPVIVKRRAYSTRFLAVTEKGAEWKREAYSIVIFCIFTLAAAILNLL